MHLFPDLPVGVSGGGDFITRSSSRDVKVTVPGGGIDIRKERWVVTDRVIQYGDPPPGPGRIAFCESTVRQMGELIGMVPEAEVHALRARASRLAAEVDDLSEQLAAERRENENLRDGTDLRVVYVAPDGTEHASRVALAAHLEGVRA